MAWILEIIRDHQILHSERYETREEATVKMNEYARSAAKNGYIVCENGTMVMMSNQITAITIEEVA